MLFWFQDSCHWYREATLFSQSTRGHHTQRTRAMLLTPWRRVYHSSHVPNLLIESCDFARVLWKVLVKGVVYLSGVSIFCPLHLKSELGASGEKQRKKKAFHTDAHKHPHVLIPNRLPQAQEERMIVCGLTHTLAVGMDWCLPHLVLIYDCSSIEATVI